MASFSSERKKQLLVVIVILAVARFVVMPILDAQAEQRQAVAMITQQLERAARLVESGSLDESLGDLRAQREQLESQLLTHASSGEFRLLAQQRVESVVEENNSQVNLFDWLSQEDVIESYLTTHQARVVVEGPPLNVVQLQLALFEEIPGLRVLEYTFFQPRASNRRRQGNARASLLIEVRGVHQ